MWRRLKNFVFSFRTYGELSPDVRVRRRVGRFLRDRPVLSADEWFEVFWQPRNISKSVADFVYTHMQSYSGLDFARVRPTDQLDKDLSLTLVCWFDWELSLCEDFLNCFGVNLCDRFDAHTLNTVEDLVVFLNRQLLSVNSS